MVKNFINQKSKIYSYYFLLLGAIITVTDTSLAYRPFVSTDAAVAETGRTEVEWGFFNFSHDHDNENLLDVPSLRLNYGFQKNSEVVAEGILQIYKQSSDRDLELKEPAVSLKTIWLEGILQGKDGPSFATEVGILLPSTIEEERNTGFSAVGIISYKLSDFLFHINAGMERDRNFKSNAVWGIIGEYPFEGKFRIAGEINGTAQNDEQPENSALIGFIWTIGKADYDFGFRKGLSDIAPDWELTAGVTFNF